MIITDKFTNIEVDYCENSLNKIFTLIELEENLIYGTTKELKELYVTKDEIPDLSKLSKVFFEQSSKFPRFKLSQYTDVKRCLDPSKADAIIVSKENMKYGYLRGANEVYYSSAENKYYHVNISRITNNVLYLLNIKDDSLLLNGLINNNIIPKDSILITKEPILTCSTSMYKGLTILLNNPSVLKIDDSNLDVAVSMKMDTPTSDDFDSIKEFLSSDDSKIVEIGMKLLLSYNISERPYSVKALILTNGPKIISTTAVTSIGFVNLLKSLDINRSALRSYRFNDIPYHLNNINDNHNSDSKEDKNEARRILCNKMEEHLNEVFDYFSGMNQLLDLNLNVKVY